MEPAATADQGHDGPSVDDPRPAPSAKPDAASPLDQLKERRRKLQEERDPLMLDIPGYGGRLVAGYKVLDWEVIKGIRDKGADMARANDQNAELKVTIDTIAAACVGIFLSEDGKTTPLNETLAEFGDDPVLYDNRLAKALGIDTDRVRVVIREIFPTDLSIFSHLEEISRWMEFENSEVDEDFS